MTDSDTEVYRKIEDLELHLGDCLLLVENEDGSGLRMYARDRSDEIQIATMPNHSDQWEFDTVTHQWSPPKFYSWGRHVDWDDFPSEEENHAL